MLNFLIAFFSIVFLAILHEFSHFIVGKKFGVEIEEFGIGYPPRLIGKKIGNTIYSLNLLPFGAFVKMPGEIGEGKNERSFSKKPVSKRILIALAGVFSFWIISAIIFSILFCFGNPVAISDEENSNLISPKVQIVAVAPNSPAEKAKLKIGDIIIKIQNSKSKIENVNKVKEVQEFTKLHLGEEIILTIERGKEIFEVRLVPRTSPPEGEGPIGIVLNRVAIKKYPLHLAIWQGINYTLNSTLAIIEGYFLAIKNIFSGKPSGIEVRGTIGIFQMASEFVQLGFIYFFNFLALLSIYLAILNALPIPAFDGGKVLFLGIEAVRKKPISHKTEEKITTLFFILLIFFAFFVTIKDIFRIIHQ